MNKVTFFFCFSLLSLWCNAALSAENNRPTVFVSIVPQKYFVQQISKELVAVEIMVQPGASPATYEPKPSQMAKLSSCMAYFAIGVPFERAWLGKISATNPGMMIVHTDRGIEKMAMASHHHDDGHSTGHHKEESHHGEESHHENFIRDPHIWLSPVLVKKQAKVILEALKNIAPEYATEFTGNYLLFQEKIDKVDSEIRAIFEGRKGIQFMVFHPSWGYFARDYGLQQIPIEIEGKAPKPAQLGELIHHAREDGIKNIFVQPQFSQKSAKVVAREIGGEVIFADPLAEDWHTNLKDIANKFKLSVK